MSPTARGVSGEKIAAKKVRTPTNPTGKKSGEKKAKAIRRPRIMARLQPMAEKKN